MDDTTANLAKIMKQVFSKKQEFPESEKIGYCIDGKTYIMLHPSDPKLQAKIERYKLLQATKNLDYRTMQGDFRKAGAKI